MDISGITPIVPLGPLTALKPLDIEALPDLNTAAITGQQSGQNGGNFSKFLTDAIKQVDALQKEGEVASVQLTTGQGEDLASVMVALEKASLSLSLLVTARDRAIDAYNQIIRMQM